MRNIIISSSFSLFLIACSASLKPPGVFELEQAKIKYPAMDSLTLHMGYQNYVLKCSSCHSLYAPQKFSYDHWSEVYGEMAEEAKLDTVEYSSIRYYLLSLAPDSI